MARAGEQAISASQSSDDSAFESIGGLRKAATPGKNKKRTVTPSGDIAGSIKNANQKSEAKGKKLAVNPAKRKRTEAQLPPHLETLLDFYAAIDTVMCFLTKQRIACKINSVQSMLKQLWPGKFGESDSILVNMRRLVEVANQVVTFEWAPEIEGELDGDWNLCLIFTKLGGTAPSRSTKRKDLVKAALLDFVQNCVSPTTNADERVGLPEPAELPSKPIGNMPTEERAPMAPIIPLKATGTAKPEMASDGGFLYTNDTSPLNPEKVLEHLRSLPFVKDQVVHCEVKSGRGAEYADTVKALPQPILDALRSKGVHRLFRHQASAIDAAMMGKHIAISTATSSGKSVVYNVPVLTKLLEATRCGQPEPVAIYLFPTKALAQDQLRSLVELCNLNQSLRRCSNIATVDGDTPQAARGEAASLSNIILTNPDMLHTTILPEHTRWTRVLGNLSFVVIDEAHMYRGAFGSHVSMVLRRLLRLAALHSKNSPAQAPQFICCSATMENPVEHFSALLPLQACLGGAHHLCCIGVADDTSPQGDKTLVLWNPPKIPCRRFADGSNSSGDHAGRTLKRKSYNLSARSREKIKILASASAADKMGQAVPRPPSDGFYNQQYISIVGKGAAPLPKERTASATEAAVEACAHQVKEVQCHKEKKASDEDSGKESLSSSPEAPEVFRRKSPIVETAMLFSALVKQRIRTISFCRTRKLTEMVLQYAIQDLQATASELVGHVKAYRGGYTKADRRLIEDDLFSGKLLGVTATSALELGIDIGDLDVSLHLGFPGSISSLWQQAGRAGRAGRNSLAIMVLFEDPISQYFARFPSELFHKAPESAVIDSNNELVLRSHLVCAASESPLGLKHPGNSGAGNRMADAALFGGEELLAATIASLSTGDAAQLSEGPNGIWLLDPGLRVRNPRPSRDVSLRMIDPVSFVVMDDSRGGIVIDTVEYSRAFFCLFENAIYLHQARQYRVMRLDIVRHQAHVTPVKVNWFTSARNNTDVNITKWVERAGDGLIGTGAVDVIDTVYGYVKSWQGSNKTFEHGECSLPPLEYATRAFWVDVSPQMIETVETLGGSVAGGIHAACHALLAVLPLFLMCDPADVDCEHVRLHQARPRPKRILIFDKRPGGIGVSEALFTHHVAAFTRALALLESCDCQSVGGCPQCIANSTCADYNSILDKAAAVALLKLALESASSKGIEELGGVGTAEIDLTPKKRQRRSNLAAAKNMDAARVRDKGIRRGWIASDHAFLCENL